MTPNEIIEEVGTLALEDVSEVDEGAFWAALNRALAQVNRIRPLTKSITIYNRSLDVVSEIREELFGTGKPVVLYAKGCACFYLQIYGQGEILLKKDGKEITKRTLLDNKKTNEYRFIVSDYTGTDTADIEIEIGGKYAGTVVNAICYSEKYSDMEDDVPSGQIYNTYSLKEISADIGHVTQILYEDAAGERRIEASDFMLPDGNMLWLLKRKEGRYLVHYAKKLKRLSVNDQDEDIEIDEDLQVLLPLLVCYYVWLEDKPELAQAMFAQYKQMEAEIRLESKVSRYPAFQDNYGW